MEFLLLLSFLLHSFSSLAVRKPPARYHKRFSRESLARDENVNAHPPVLAWVCVHVRSFMCGPIWVINHYSYLLFSDLQPLGSNIKKPFPIREDLYHVKKESFTQNWRSHFLLTALLTEALLTPFRGRWRISVLLLLLLPDEPLRYS